MSTLRVRPIIPPKADTGSQASAFLKASSGVAPYAVPQGRRVLDYRAGADVLEYGAAAEQRIKVEQVVEGELFARELLEGTVLERRHEERGLLVRGSLRSGVPAPCGAGSLYRSATFSSTPTSRQSPR